MKTPYLIQRGVINIPLSKPSALLSEAVDLDYMGSAEFEFGALARSLRAVQASSVRGLRMLNSITENNVPLRAFSVLDDTEFSQYVKFLLRMRGNDLHLKENSGFSPHSFRFLEKPNFWWDIENHVMWSFNKMFMNRLHDFLNASFKKMDKK